MEIDLPSSDSTSPLSQIIHSNSEMKVVKELSNVGPKWGTSLVIQFGNAFFLYIARTVLIDVYKIENDKLDQCTSILLSDEKYEIVQLCFDQFSLYAAVNCGNKGRVYQLPVNVNELNSSSNKVLKATQLFQIDQKIRSVAAINTQLNDRLRIYYIAEDQTFYAFTDQKHIKLKVGTKLSKLYTVLGEIYCINDTQLIFVSQHKRENLVFPNRILQVIAVGKDVYVYQEHGIVSKLTEQGSPEVVLNVNENKMKIDLITSVNGNLFVVSFDQKVSKYKMYLAMGQLSAKAIIKLNQVEEIFALTNERCIVLSNTGDISLLNPFANQTVLSTTLSFSKIQSPQIQSNLVLANNDTQSVDGKINTQLALINIQTNQKKPLTSLADAKVLLKKNLLLQYNSDEIFIVDIENEDRFYKIQLPNTYMCDIFERSDKLVNIVICSNTSMYHKIVNLDERSCQDNFDWNVDSKASHLVLNDDICYFTTQMDAKEQRYLLIVNLKEQSAQELATLMSDPDAIGMVNSLAVVGFKMYNRIDIYSPQRLLDSVNLKKAIIDMCNLGQGKLGILYKGNIIQEYDLFDQQVISEKVLGNVGIIDKIAQWENGITVSGSAGLFALRIGQ